MSGSDPSRDGSRLPPLSHRSVRFITKQLGGAATLAQSHPDPMNRISPFTQLSAWLLLASVVQAPAALIVNDGFSDGGRTATGTLGETDLNWFAMSTPSTFQVQTDSVMPGNVLRSTNTPQFTGTIGLLPNAVTLNDGDTLTLSFSYRLPTVSGFPNAAGGFRFGLFNSSGTITTADNQSSSRTDDIGYVTSTNAGLNSSTGTTIGRETAGNEIGSGAAPGNVTTFGSSGQSVNTVTGDVRNAMFSLTRTGGALQFSSKTDTNLLAATGVDNAPLTWTFNELYIGLGAANGFSFAVDNVQLNHTAVPEPSAIGLCLAGLTALLTLRRRNRRNCNGRVAICGKRII